MIKIRYLWEKLNASFWFLPSLILLVSLLAALGLILVDDYLELQPGDSFNFLFTGSAASARSILSTIAGAMIGVAGTVFSITIVALTLASSQFGPRLLRNFMYDRVNQVVLGTYISTFVYCLLVLSSVRAGENAPFVPVVSVSVAVLVAVANIILLIIFIHHIAISMQSDKVVSDISSSMSRNILNLFPEKLGDDPLEEEPELSHLLDESWLGSEVTAEKSGYLQSMDSQTLLHLATDHNLLILLHHRPGDHVVKDQSICRVLSPEPLADGLPHKILRNFIFGKVRTPLQDAEFAIHQMVEIALRALSPGINDPYTAITCIDQLSAVLCYLANARFPSHFRFDEEGNLRVVTERLTFSGMLGAAFNQIRQFGKGSPSVIIRLMEALVTIHNIARFKKQKEAVLRHADMVMRAAEKSFEEENDLIDLQERYAGLEETD